MTLRCNISKACTRYTASGAILVTKTASGYRVVTVGGRVVSKAHTNLSTPCVDSVLLLRRSVLGDETDVHGGSWQYESQSVVPICALDKRLPSAQRYQAFGDRAQRTLK